jgi:hypothetical protein
MKKYCFCYIIILLFLTIPLIGAVILQPDFANKEINYINSTGKKIYGEIIEGKTIFQDGALFLKKQELSYPAHNLVNLNNGSVTFQIQPVNWAAGISETGGYKLLPIFAVSTDKGYPQLCIFLSNTSSGSHICFYSWYKNHDVQASTLIDSKSPLLSKNRWTRISATWDPQYINIYLDGKEVASASYGLSSDRNTTPDLFIRFMPVDYAGVEYKLDTLIKDFTLYDHTLIKAEVKADYESANIKTENILHLGAITLPFTTNVPKIDGKIDSAEWQDATSFPLQKRNSSLLLDSDLPAQVYGKYDGENIYLAYTVKYSGELVLPAPKDKFSQQVYSGNLVEFYYRPNSENINKFYQFTVGANNAFAVRTPDNKFVDIPFKHATKINDKEWNVEMAIPLNTVGGIQAGESFAGNFGLYRPEVNQLNAPDRWITWSGVKSDAFFRNVGQVMLGTPKSSTQLKQLGQLNYGSPDVIWQSLQPTNVELQFLDGSGKMLINKKYDKVTNFAFKDKLTWHGGGFMLLKATTMDGKVLNDYSGMFIIREPYTVIYDCFASLSKMALNVDVQGLKTNFKTNPLPFKATLTGDKDGKLYASTQIVLDRAQSTVDLPFKELLPGKYKLASTITVDGKDFVLYSTFERPNDNFIRHPVGLERTIPLPWCPLSRKNNSIITKYCSYEFSNDSLFPITAVIHGKKVLLASQMVIGNQNQNANFKLTENKNIENSPDKIVDIGTMIADSLKLKLEYKRTISYDGMIRYDLALEPIDKSARIDNFSLIFDLPEDASKYAINPDKSPSFVKAWNNTQNLEIRQFPVVWLTGLNAGFSVFTDNDANWVYPESQLPFVMRHCQNKNQIEVNFINGEANLITKTSYVLAMMATPSKEPRADYRQIHVKGEPKVNEQGGNFYCIRGWEHERDDFYWFHWTSLTRLQNPDKAKARIKMFFDRGIKSLPYNCGSVMSDSNPIYDYYGNDWRRYANGKIQPKAEYMTDLDGAKFYGAVPICANNSGFADYMTYYMDKYLEEYNMCGLYLDFGGVYQSDKPYKDTLLTDVVTPGRQVTSYNVFGVRDLYERLRKTMQKHNPENILWLHEWDKYHPAVISFGDIIYPGEEFMHSIRNNLRVYGDETPLSAWQAAYNSNVYGAAVQFLHQYRYYTDPIYNNNKTNLEKMYFARDLMTMVLLHDIPMSDYFMEDIYVIFDTNKVKNAQFHAYYTDAKVKTDNNQVKVSYYQWSNCQELLMILGNVSKKEQKFAIDFGDFKVKVEAIDALTKEKIDLTKSLTLGDYGFKLIWVKF